MKTAGKRAPGVVRGMRVGVLVVVSLGVGCWLALHSNAWPVRLITAGGRSTAFPPDSQKSGGDTWTVHRFSNASSDEFLIKFASDNWEPRRVSTARALDPLRAMPAAVDLDRTLPYGQGLRIRTWGWPLRHSYVASITLYTDTPSESLTPLSESWAGTLWLGLVVDTVFLSLPVLGTAALLTWAFRAIRRYFRRRPGLCGECGYDLRGLRGAVCPECGAANPMCGDAT